MSGRAPPSLMEMCRPPAGRRVTKSSITASQTAAKPCAAVATSILQISAGRRRSIRTSRLPEATTLDDGAVTRSGCGACRFHCETELFHRLIFLVTNFGTGSGAGKGRPRRA